MALQVNLTPLHEATVARASLLDVRAAGFGEPIGEDRGVTVENKDLA